MSNCYTTAVVPRLSAVSYTLNQSAQEFLTFSRDWYILYYTQTLKLTRCGWNGKHSSGKTVLLRTHEEFKGTNLYEK